MLLVQGCLKVDEGASSFYYSILCIGQITDDPTSVFAIGLLSTLVLVPVLVCNSYLVKQTANVYCSLPTE